MDDDIRDRFRGVSKRQTTPTGYGRDTRPVVRPTSPPQRPSEQPNRASKPSVKLKAPKVAVPVPRLSLHAKRRKPKRKLFKRKKSDEKRSKKKKMIIFGIVLLLILAALGGYLLTRGKSSGKTDEQFQQELHTPQVTTESSTKPVGTVRFIAVGDSLAYDSINAAAKKPDGSYDYLPMMAGFKTFFEKSDIGLCNETSPGGGDTDGLAISGYPAFNAPLAWSSGFAGLGCNVINLASDHINDKGQTAINNTLSTWDSTKNVLAVAGANRSAEEQAKIHYFTVKGLKFAYLAYTTKSANSPANTYGVNIYSDDLANKQIAEAHKNAQLVIVSMTWGTEDSSDINSDQGKIAQNLANQNVDVVVGGGPRVVQPAKSLSGTDGHQTLVWFSLGNFLGSALPINNLIGGMAVVDFDVSTQKLTDSKFMPVYMHYEWTTAQKSAKNISARHDFMLWPLDLAAEALAKSQNNTTVEAQTARVTDIITKFTPIKVIKSTEF